MAGVMPAHVEWVLSVVTAAVMKNDDIVPSEHSNGDVKCDLYISGHIGYCKCKKDSNVD